MLQDIELGYENGAIATSRALSASGVGIGTSSPLEALDLSSDTSTQRRLRTVSYFETDPVGSAETIRLHFGNAAGKTGSSAKNAIAWFADNVSTAQSQVWVQAHDYLHWYNAQTIASVDTATNRVTLSASSDLPDAWKVSFSSTGTLPAPLSAATAYYAKRISATVFEVYSDSAMTTVVDITNSGAGAHTMTPDNEFNNNHHRHFSVEVSNADLQNKNTRFSIPWGYDWTQIGFFQGDVNVNGGKFRVVGEAGSYRQIILGNTLSDNLVPDGTEGRWSIQANSTAEAAGNLGSDFRLVRYSNTGVALDAPLFVKRSNGRVAMGNLGITDPLGAVHIGYSGGGSVLRLTSTLLGGTGSSHVFMESADTIYRLIDARVTGDANARAVMLMDRIEWGDGVNGRDTNLYRSSANVLRTDDTFHVDVNLRLRTTDLGGGSGVIAIANATTVPTVATVGGGVLYAEAGALKWMGPSGVPVTIAAA